MPNLAHWTVFLGATLVLLVTPGPSIMYVVARGIAQGWRAAVLSSVGLALGDSLQVVGTAFGLSAMLASAPKLFAGLKLAGAGYLVSLGIMTLLGKSTRVIESTVRSNRQHAISSRSLILQAFLAFNPKTALFFLAFLPQFIAPQAGPVAIQLLYFGTVFVIAGLVTNSFFGCVGGSLGAFAGNNTRFRVATRYVGGGILIVLGIAAALAPGPYAPSAFIRFPSRNQIANGNEFGGNLCSNILILTAYPHAKWWGTKDAHEDEGPPFSFSSGSNPAKSKRWHCLEESIRSANRSNLFKTAPLLLASLLHMGLHSFLAPHDTFYPVREVGEELVGVYALSQFEADIQTDAKGRPRPCSVNRHGRFLSSCIVSNMGGCISAGVLS